MTDREKSRVERFRTWRRRRKVSKGYQKIAEAKLDKRYGFSPIILKWELMQRDGFIEIEDGGKRWVWP